MKRLQRWPLTLVLGLVVTGNASAVAQNTAEGADTSLTITIHVFDYAEGDHKTLMEAEKIAAGIFRKARVETRWTYAAPAAPKINQENSTGQSLLDLPDIDVNIVPRVMADRLGLPNEAMGLAPGTEPDRQVVYVSYNSVEALARSQARAVYEGSIRRPATTAQVLGHAIAHEIGHLLLNLESHSATGIMRGDWNLNDLRDIASGFLLFTPQQAEVIRAEVARRARVRRLGQLQMLPALSRRLGSLPGSRFYDDEPA